MQVLVLNAGSSTLKWAVMETMQTRPPDLPREAGGLSQPVETTVLRGMVDRIGTPDASLRCGDAQPRPCAAPDHAAALAPIAELLAEHDPGIHIRAVVHRIAHGGRLRRTVRVDDATEQAIDAATPLAPLHNPPALAVIRAARLRWPELDQVAAFDTAFHRTIPDHAATMAVPRHWREDLGLKVYGFHGFSHAYVAHRAAELLGRPLEELNLITVHLGNGASVAAVAGGRSVDTSLGMSTLGGLVMGTRGGDLDPGALLYAMAALELSPAQAETALSRESGLYGLCGASDVRDIRARAESGDISAHTALEIAAYRLRKYLGAYFFVLDRVDAVVFTAGIGENDSNYRAASCQGLGRYGIVLDSIRNARCVAGVSGIISAEDSPVAVCVIQTDEEAMLAREAAALLAEPLPIQPRSREDAPHDR